MEIDLGNGVKRKDIEGIRKRNNLIVKILLGLTVLLFIFKVIFMPDLKWIIVFLPIWVGAFIRLIMFMTGSLIMRFAKDF